MQNIVVKGSAELSIVIQHAKHACTSQPGLRQYNKAICTTQEARRMLGCPKVTVLQIASFNDILDPIGQVLWSSLGTLNSNASRPKQDNVHCQLTCKHTSNPCSKTEKGCTLSMRAAPNAAQQVRFPLQAIGCARLTPSFTRPPPQKSSMLLFSDNRCFVFVFSKHMQQQHTDAHLQAHAAISL